MRLLPRAARNIKAMKDPKARSVPRESRAPPSPVLRIRSPTSRRAAAAAPASRQIRHRRGLIRLTPFVYSTVCRSRYRGLEPSTGSLPDESLSPRFYSPNDDECSSNTPERSGRWSVPRRLATGQNQWALQDRLGSCCVPKSHPHTSAALKPGPPLRAVEDAEGERWCEFPAKPGRPTGHFLRPL